MPLFKNRQHHQPPTVSELLKVIREMVEQSDEIIRAVRGTRDGLTAIERGMQVWKQKLAAAADLIERLGPQ